MKPITGKQLVMVQMLRSECGLHLLPNHVIRHMNIACASQMIEDLTHLRDTLKSLSA